MNPKLKKVYDRYGSTICLLPFFNAFVNDVEDSVTPCCNWIENDNRLSLDVLEEINNDSMLSARKAHGKNLGLELQGCLECKSAEAQGLASLRTKTNSNMIEYLDDPAAQIAKIINNNYQVNDLVAVDYFPSRYCNLACITCYPSASTTREKHVKRFSKSYQQTKHQDFKNIDKILSNANMIALTGGETLQQLRVLQIIDRLLISGEQASKEIYIVTNLTKYYPQVYSKLEKFAKARVTFSMDGIGKTFEYQRIGADWFRCQANFRKIVQSHPAIEWCINYVVSAVSFAGINQFLLWCYVNQVQDVMFTAVKGKEYLSHHALPPVVFDRIRHRYRELRRKFKDRDSTKDFSQVLEAVDSYFDSYCHQSELTERLITKLNREDSARTDGVSWTDILPELEEYANGS